MRTDPHAGQGSHRSLRPTTRSPRCSLGVLGVSGGGHAPPRAPNPAHPRRARRGDHGHGNRRATGDAARRTTAARALMALLATDPSAASQPGELPATRVLLTILQSAFGVFLTIALLVHWQLTSQFDQTLHDL